MGMTLCGRLSHDKRQFVKYLYMLETGLARHVISWRSVSNPPDRQHLSSSAREMTGTNFYVVQSVTNFQELMSADLNKIAVINFWAPWAEPCKRMNDFIESDLSKKHPHVLFLQVRIRNRIRSLVWMMMMIGIFFWV